MQHEQPGELACLEYGPLTVLASDDDGDLERRPRSIRRFGKRPIQTPPLPRVQVEPGELGEVGSLNPAVAASAGQVTDPRKLRADLGGDC